MSLNLRKSAYICGSKHKLQNYSQIGSVIVSSCGLAAAIIGIGSSKATAQLTIQSTGTLSGTIQLPSFNPNFNNRVTRVDTNSKGTYYRNIGTTQNPKNVPVYTSNYVKVQTRADGTLGYYVDFKGIPVVSLDGILSSPALSGGQLTPYNYHGKIPGTKFQGVVQDEFGLTKAYYTGVVTDPKTGQKYQGTFEVNGQGPRYSDRNGNATPTVFDFKSDAPGKPSVTSLKMTNAPLVRLTIKVPANATSVSSGNKGTTPTPSSPSTSATTPPPSPPTGVNPPIVSATPVPSTGNTKPTSSPSTLPNIEFSSGNSLTTDRVPTVDSKGNLSNSVQPSATTSVSQQSIGPRSRVMLR